MWWFKQHFMRLSIIGFTVHTLSLIWMSQRHFLFCFVYFMYFSILNTLPSFAWLTQKLCNDSVGERCIVCFFCISFEAWMFILCQYYVFFFRSIFQCILSLWHFILLLSLVMCVFLFVHKLLFVSSNLSIKLAYISKLSRDFCQLTFITFR